MSTQRLAIPALLLVLLAACHPALETIDGHAAQQGDPQAQAAGDGRLVENSGTATITDLDPTNIENPDAAPPAVAPAVGDDPATQDPAAPPPVPPVTDACDDNTYTGVDWETHSSTHFRLHYFPGTPAETDREIIVAAREAAYQAIRARLQVSAEPTIDVYLSPSRVAARAHGVGVGRSYPGQDRIEVVYTGATDGYETVRVGHEITHVLGYYLAVGQPTRVKILDEGLAEQLDQSGRDLHRAYAEQLIAGIENRTYVAALEDSDTWGANYGRAGSLVQYLNAAHGEDAVSTLLQATAMIAGQSCHATFGCLRDAQELAAFLDSALRSTLHVTWDEVRAGWLAEVEAALALAPSTLPSGDEAEIRALIGWTDAAISGDDAALYRATMEGFYCDWGGEAMRQDIASRTVTAFSASQSQVWAVYPTGTRNFTTALALVLRAEPTGTLSMHPIHVEHTPAGWRITWAPDWY